MQPEQTSLKLGDQKLSLSEPGRKFLAQCLLGKHGDNV